MRTILLLKAKADKTQKRITNPGGIQKKEPNVPQSYISCHYKVWCHQGKRKTSEQHIIVPIYHIPTTAPSKKKKKNLKNMETLA